MPRMPRRIELDQDGCYHLRGQVTGPVEWGPLFSPPPILSRPNSGTIGSVGQPLATPVAPSCGPQRPHRWRRRLLVWLPLRPHQDISWL
jgi:hypothetical protein